MTTPRHCFTNATPVIPAGMTGRSFVSLALLAATACSGCGWASSFVAPGKFQNAATATPLPPAFSQPPCEPPAAPVASPPPATVVIEPPKAEEPPAPVETADTAALRDEISLLKSELGQLRSRQDQSQSALESLTASSLATASRAAAIEAHLALQSSLIDDLRTATQQQQREQWKALDAVSEGIDRMLKRNQEPAPGISVPGSTPAPATEKPYIGPGEVPLQEILSQQPEAHGAGGLR